MEVDSGIEIMKKYTVDWRKCQESETKIEPFHRFKFVGGGEQSSIELSSQLSKILSYSLFSFTIAASESTNESLLNSELPAKSRTETWLGSARSNPPRALLFHRLNPQEVGAKIIHWL
jgi:hypothetical protein